VGRKQALAARRALNPCLRGVRNPGGPSPGELLNHHEFCVYLWLSGKPYGVLVIESGVAGVVGGALKKKPVSSTLYGDDKASSRLFSLNCVAGE